MAATTFAIEEMTDSLIGRLAPNTFIQNRSKLRVRISGSVYTKPNEVEWPVWEIHRRLPSGGSELFSSATAMSQIQFTKISSTQWDFTSSFIIQGLANFGSEFKFDIWVMSKSVYVNSSHTGLIPEGITAAIYTSPTISSFTAQRSNYSGTPTTSDVYISFSTICKFQSLASKNSVTLTTQTRVNNGAWGTAQAVSYSVSTSGDISTITITNRVLSGTFSSTLSWDVKLTLKDMLESVEVVAPISSGSVLFHLKGDGTGLGIGGYATTSNLFEVSNMASRFNSTVTVNGYTYLNGGVSFNGGGLALSNGGTGATNQSGALTNLGFQRGTIYPIVNANSYVDTTVYFTPSYSAPPIVVATVAYAGTSTSNAITCFVFYVDAGYCRIRCTKMTSTQATIPINWIAIPA